MCLGVYYQKIGNSLQRCVAKLHFQTAALGNRPPCYHTYGFSALF